MLDVSNTKYNSQEINSLVRDREKQINYPSSEGYSGVVTQRCAIIIRWKTSRTSRNEVIDLLCNVKLEYLVCSLLGYECSELRCHAWYPRRKMKGGDVVRKRNLRPFFSRITWHLCMPLPEQVGTIFSPLLHIFGLLLEEFFPSSVLPWKWIFNWFYFYNSTFGVREYILSCAVIGLLIP